VSAAAIAIIAVACGGSNPSSDRDLGDVLVLTPTPAPITCLNANYPDDAPAFGDDSAIAYETLPSGVAVFDHQVGDGSSLKTDSDMRVHYTGFFDDGCVFDTSYTRGAPVTFQLNNLIQGWQIGMADMLEGGKRRIRIPSNLAYGDAGLNISGFVIPGSATLIFEVELLEVVQ
jgi:FKBP-type peptidyl-prolyl cis-trans isomerase